MATSGTYYQQLTKTYNSYSGTDIKTTIGGVEFGTLQGVSFTVMREKAPVYTMGLADPRGFSRGKRGISGSLMFMLFDRAALIHELRELNRANFWAKKQEIKYTTFRRDEGPAPVLASFPDRYGLVESVPAWYVDQIPPFTIVLTAANEYGHRSRMEIHGCEILNNGSGVSVDDMTIDESMTFVCTDIIPWRAETYLAPDGIGGLSSATSIAFGPHVSI